MNNARVWPRRHVVVALCACSLFICYIDRVNISIAIIPMAEQFGWSDYTKGLVFASFFVGYLATQAIGGWLSNRYGGKYVLGFAVLWWSLFTILTPVAAGLALPLLLATRAIMGLGEGLAYPATFTLLSRWVPAHERSRATTFCHSAASLGVVAAILVAPWIAVTLGWEAIFYIFGGIGFFWYFFWHRYASSTPRKHPSITCEELDEIEQTTGNDEKITVPWSELARLPAVWAVFVNHFCFSWGLFVLLSWLPSYFSSQLNIQLESVWVYTVPPWLVLFLTTNTAGHIADRLIAGGMSVTLVRKLAQSVGMLGLALGLLALNQVSSAVQAVILLCFAIGLGGFALAGFGTNFLDIAPRYAGIVWGVSNTFATIPGIVGVVITGWLVETTGTYSSAFVLTAALNFFAVMVWWLFATGEQQVE